MRGSNRSSRWTGLAATAAGLAIVISIPVAAAPRLDVVAKEPPNELQASAASLLAPEALRLVDGEKTLAEIWIRKELPLRPAPGEVLEVAFGGIPPCTLVGAARFPEGWSDYRGRRLTPGTYTLRYALRPSDGNHMGVSEFRDFLLPVPAADDKSGAACPGDEALVALSRKGTGGHPGIMALLPVPPKVAAPAFVDDGAGHGILAVRGGASPLGLVLVGRAESQ